MAQVLDLGSSLLRIDSRLSQNNFHLCQKCKAYHKSSGMQRETTPVKNLDRKITMERIISIIIFDARNRVWHLMKKKKKQSKIVMFFDSCVYLIFRIANMWILFKFLITWKKGESRYQWRAVNFLPGYAVQKKKHSFFKIIFYSCLLFAKFIDMVIFQIKD